MTHKFTSFLIFSILSLCIYHPFQGHASTIENSEDLIEIYLHQSDTDDDNTSDEEQGKHNHGERMPQRPIVCSISNDSGISLPNYFDVSEISSFEIWNQNNCIAAFGDQSDFINLIFSLKGEYQIVFRSPNYFLYGVIYL